MSDDVRDRDDTRGHVMGDEVGQLPVEEGRRRPAAIGDEDDVQGHRRTARADGTEDEDDVQGHRRTAR